VPEHARSGGVAGPRVAGGHVDIAGRPQVHPRVFDGRLVVLAESEPGDDSRRAEHGGPGRREQRAQGHGEPDKRGQQRPQQRGPDGQGAAISRHSSLHRQAVHPFR